MKRKAESELSNKERWKRYRDQHQQQRKELISRVRKNRDLAGPIIDILVKPDSIDMESFSGTERELEYAVEHLYANDGRWVIQNHSKVVDLVC
jgi:hypothetical protein